MSLIDYKAEVLRIFPNAEIFVDLDNSYRMIIQIQYNMDAQIISNIQGTDYLAWQSAYETLKKDGKIK